MVEQSCVFKLPIETPSGVINITVNYRVINVNDNNMQAFIYTDINNQTIQFNAETTEDVLLKLAKALPKHWKIKSCLSCKYGNFCPVGNYDNEIFCTSDFELKDIEQLYYITENDKERTKRSKTLFYCCNNHTFQSEDYFTYNDYFHEINKNKL